MAILVSCMVATGQGMVKESQEIFFGFRENWQNKGKMKQSNDTIEGGKKPFVAILKEKLILNGWKERLSGEARSRIYLCGQGQFYQGILT